MSPIVPPPLREAIARQDYPAVLRLARELAGWTQTELAHRLGFHPSVISRFESRRRPLRDVKTLQRLAEVLPVPLEAFGLHDHEGVATRRGTPGASRVIGSPDREEDDVRRRSFLKVGSLAVGATVAGAAPPAAANPAALAPDPATVLTARLSDVLVGTPTAHGATLPAEQLTRGLAAARTAFGKSDFLALADVLPPVVRAAEAIQDPGALAQAYTLITRALAKLAPNGLEWISADRAVRAAGASGEPLVLAEAERMLSGVCRRAGHHAQAQALVLGAADRLTLDGRDPRHLVLHSSLLCTGGYAAARAGDGIRARDLLDAAATTAARLSGDAGARAGANLLSHRVSVEHLLGDPAAAIQHARTAGPVRFPDAEREGRFLVDLAAVHLDLGNPGSAYNTLLAAERRAPGEVYTRSAVRDIVGVLLTQARVPVPGIRDLAARVHVAN
ncbi:helix-turn-helix domain-containing protein [Amycolatopsis sp. lyj-109]|uniref:helix-turn-helix domain-containing protein n=1 Tax=Amycolatopsis sp. lyj-109 TaxID=2789287 RepID=UPI0039787F53